MIEIQPAIFGHADILSPRLREADLQEIKASVGKDPLVILKNGIAWSDPCYTIIDKVNPLAIFGVVPDLHTASVGRIWFLGSDELFNHSYKFLRHSREWIDKLHQRYPTLWNYVDARNEVHIRWLKWCGFTFLRRIEDYGVERRLFYEFERVAAFTPLPPCKPDD